MCDNPREGLRKGAQKRHNDRQEKILAKPLYKAKLRKDGKQAHPPLIALPRYRAKEWTPASRWPSLQQWYRSSRELYQTIMNLIQKGTKAVRSRPTNWRTLRGKEILRGR